MPLHIEWSRQSALMRRIEAVRAAGRPGSKQMNKAQSDIRKVVVEDHTRMMLSGQTKDGGQRAPLSPRTLADPRRGPGPSLVPHGSNSRYIKNFEAVWLPGGGPNPTALTLVMRYRDFVSKKGVPIPPIHERGTARIPARPVGGVSNEGFREIGTIMHRLGADVLKGA
jgi:hypothetical protein